MPVRPARKATDTFEKFIDEMKKDDAETNKYYWGLVKVAEKERARLRAKDKARYEKIKALKANSPAQSIVPGDSQTS